MQNKKVKVKFDIPLEYVIGYLRCGYKEGILELTEEEFEKLEKDPMEFVNSYDILWDLDLVIDDYRIEDFGPALEINYEKLIDEINSVGHVNPASPEEIKEALKKVSNNEK